MKPAEAFRKHHEELVEEFDRLSSRTRNGDDQAFETLFEYLETQILPHAEAEEEVLYDRVDELSGTELATASMRRDHEEIERRVREFDNDLFPEQFGERVSEFSALFLHHFHKEEDVLLPFLSEQLSKEEFGRLLERTHEREESYRES